MGRKLKVIDGTGDGKFAPSPHRGLVKALYETVDACGGADITQIKKYLPAAIENINQVLTTSKIEKSLYNAVYRGYLVHNPSTGYWQVAPISYYKARQEVIKDIESRTNRDGVPKRREPLQIQSHGFFTFHQWYAIISMMCVAFVFGFVVGLAAHLVL